MSSKPRIIFCCTGLSSFVQKDITFLEEKYNVIPHVFSVKIKWATPFRLIHQFFFLLFHLPKSKLIICQFAGYHSFFPSFLGKIFGKPCLIICGGTECVSFPSIRYGNFNKRLLGFFTACSVKMATHLAPKHETLIDYSYSYDNKDFQFQGLKHFIKNFNTPYTVIYNGYESEKFKCTVPKKQNSFITVAAGVDLSFTVPLKGIDLIMEVAPHFPQCTFTIIGVPEGFNIGAKSSNIVCLPELKNKDLVKLYSEHEFYLQLSMSEGFPNALCEAMLCECIPIGSDVNSIPEIIGETGFILKKRNPVMLKVIIEKSLSADKLKLAQAARKRIADNFTIAKRKSKLLSLVEAMLRRQ